jgi:hypothetical protein
MRGDQIGEVENDAGEDHVLGDEHGIRLDFDTVRLLTRAALDGGIDQRQRQHCADRERGRIERAGAREQLRNEAR